ncbi:MAG: hypothetical protein Q4A17_08320 [Thermoguttaceae bacterium]|nr:hypothetical protein [Thermoguttaceae bacterium]
MTQNRQMLWRDKELTGEEFTAEDSVWYRFFNNEICYRNVHFRFENIEYHIFFKGPAKAFQIFPSGEKTELESHDWEDWQILMEEIRWNNGKTFSEMLRNMHWSELQVDKYEE